MPMPKRGLDIDTLIHESGAPALINFNTATRCALAAKSGDSSGWSGRSRSSDNVYATFDGQSRCTISLAVPSSAPVDGPTTRAAEFCSRPRMAEQQDFRPFRRCLQKYPAADFTPLHGAQRESFRRMRPASARRSNLQWATTPSCGLRVPLSDGQNRRIENRIPGADANPYLAIARRWSAYVGLVRRSSRRRW